MFSQCSLSCVLTTTRSRLVLPAAFLIFPQIPCALLLYPSFHPFPLVFFSGYTFFFIYSCLLLLLPLSTPTTNFSSPSADTTTSYTLKLHDRLPDA